MHLIRLALFILLIPLWSAGQTSTDSLYDELREKEDVEARLSVYSQLIHELSFTDVSEAIALSEQAIEELDNNHDDLNTADLYNSIGIAYNFNGNYLVSIEYFLKALYAYEAINDSSRIANVLNNIGITYTEVKNFEKSKSFYKRSLAIHRRLKNVRETAAVLNNLGNAFEAQGLIDSAANYYQKSLELALENDCEPRIADANLNLGSISLKLGHYAKALDHLKIARQIDEKRNNMTGLVETYALFGEVYLAQGAYDLSESFLAKALELSRKMQMKNRESEVYRVYSIYYANTGNFRKAYESHKKYAWLKDSIYSLEAKRQIEDLQLSYENEKKIQEIDFLNERASLQETQLKLQKTKTRFLLVFTLFTIFFLGLLMINIRTKSRANQLLKARSEKIQQQNIELENRSNKLLELSEEKENFISVVAHDLKSPLNNIAGLANLLRINGKLNEEQLHYLNLLDQVSNEAKNLITNLLEINKLESGNIDHNSEEFNIIEVIDHEISFFKKDTQEKNIKVIKNYPDSIIIKNNKEFIQRIFYNLISNAIKFSKENTAITIYCNSQDKILTLSVKDEGPGIRQEEQKNLFKKFQKLSIRPTHGESSTGLGLAIVKLLVDKLGGEIKVISEER